MRNFMAAAVACTMASKTDALQLRSEPSEKWGLCCYDCEEQHYSALTPISNWAYNYRLWPTDEMLANNWAEDTKVEFVPMFIGREVNLMEWSGWKKCSVNGLFWNDDTDQYEESHNQKACTLEELVSIIDYAKSVTTVKHLMGFNEPYEDPDGNRPWKWQDPDEAAKWWSLFIQPLAEATELELVSTTTGAWKEEQLDWQAHFIKACYDLREADSPCDIEKIKVWSVHDYRCEEAEGKLYEDGGQFHTLLSEKLEELAPNTMDWLDYVQTRDIWMTEVNCNQDDFSDENTQKTGCQKVTGQLENVKSNVNSGVGKVPYGGGAMAEYLKNDKIKRISWWSGFNPLESWEAKSAARSRLTNEEGELLPTGRALIANLDPEKAQCDAEPQE